MRALVVGASGFIGGHLVERLVDEGADVRAFVRDERDTSHLAFDVQRYVGDLEDAESVAPAVRGRDVVFHLAAARAECGPGHSGRPATDVVGTENLARAAAREGARLVFASSRGVHGNVRGIIDEKTPLAPDTLYRLSKVEAERRLRALAADGALRLVILRLPSTIGPRARSWLGLYRAVGRGRFRLIGSGRNRLHPCPVEDVVEAFVLAARSSGREGETYIISGRESVALRDFIESIAAALEVRISRLRLPLAPFRAASALRRGVDRELGGPSTYEMFLTSYEIDFSKARRELGYEPSGSLRHAIRRTADWYRSEGLL
ncbi:MAG TPA: NAD-dependent epimerase/dehydratase family protein [Candidatus Polarisedimenticolia bacterium]|nr:NAD-dependent epimerase/dehydratase family protein [Candidatus Polarisedimenticolia bacterium]